MPILVDGELVLYGFVGDDLFDDGFTDRQVLEALVEVGRETDITVRLNSGGGYTDAGKAIFNALSAHAGRVTISVDGIAASIASVIAMAGDEIVMRSGALMMIHEASGMTFGDADEHRRSVEWLERESASIASIYAEKTDRTVEEMRDLMKAETWLTADEAVEQGFADSADSAEARAVAAFDYRAYPNAPRALKAKARKKNWSLPEAKAVASASAPPRQKEDPMTDKPKAEVKAADPVQTDPQAEPTTPQSPAQPPADPPAAAAPAQADADALRAEGRATERAYRNEVEDLCKLAGQPERARAFIDAEASVADVRKKLLEDRATADAARQISTQYPAGGGAPEKGALAGRMKRLVGKEA